MDIRKIKKLMDLIEASDLAEVEIVEGEESIRLTRASAMQMQMPMMPQQQMQMPMQAAPAQMSHASSVAVEEAPVQTGHQVASPMVGTYYASPKPEAPDFVKVGDSVQVGDTLCIIEAMKIFNTIEADKSGKVKAVLKGAGDAVEYGEALFIIE